MLLRKFTNGQEFVEINGSSPIDCLRNLEVTYPGMGAWLFNKKGEPGRATWLFLNGERIYAEEFDKPLKDGDDLFVMLAIAGG